MKIIESAIRGLKSGIKRKESTIPRTIITQNQSTTDKDCNLVPGFRNPRRGIKNLRLTWISLRGSKFGSVEKELLNVTLQMKPTQHVSCVTFYYDGTESVYQILKSDYAFKLRKATKDNFPCGTVYCIVQGIVLSFESLDEFKIQLPCSAHGDLLRCCLLRRLSKWF